MTSRILLVIAGLMMISAMSGVSFGESRDGHTTSLLKVVMAPATEAFFVGGPVAISLDITNASDRAIAVEVDALGAPNFTVSMTTPEGVEIHAMRQWNEGSRQLTPIPVGGTFKAVVFLNNLLPFRFPGKYKATLSCTLSAYPQPQAEAKVSEISEDVKCSQKVTVIIKSASDKAIRTYLDKEIVKVLGDDRQSQTVAMAAMCCVDSPLVVPYLVRTLRVSQTQYAAIIGLARFDSAEATSALRGMLTSNRADIVKAVLGALDCRDSPATDDELTNLLASDKAPLRYVALEYAKERKRAIPEGVLAKLVEDKNPGIAKLARQYAEDQKQH